MTWVGVPHKDRVSAGQEKSAFCMGVGGGCFRSVEVPMIRYLFVCATIAWVVVGGCSGTGDTTVTVRIPREALAYVSEMRVFLVKDRGERDVCRLLESSALSVEDLAAEQTLVLSGGLEEGRLENIRAGRWYLVVDVRNEARVMLLQGCTSAEIDSGTSRDVVVTLYWVCHPTEELPGNALDDDCDGITDECSLQGECDDGNPCTVGVCGDDGICRYSDLDGQGCDDGDSCTQGDMCRQGRCVGTLRDDDNDGHVAIECGGDDCDDSRSEVHPDDSGEGLPGSLTCGDGLDNDCDGVSDSEDVDCMAGFEVSGIASPVRKGVAYDLTIRAVDAWGHTVSGYRGTVLFDSSDLLARLPTQYRFTDMDRGEAVVSGAVIFQTEGLQWLRVVDNDRGLDGIESDIWVYASPVRYRSVGPGNEEPLAVGADLGIVSIAGGRASFSAPLPDVVGVGDVLEYDRNGDGAYDGVVVISRRNSATEFVVETAEGGVAPVLSETWRWELYRAYASLSDAEDCRENPGIAPNVRDFDPGTGGRDLVATGVIWAMACYADNRDRGRVTFHGTWVTGPSNYIRVFAPEFDWEVGQRQRHEGAWTDSAYVIEVPASATSSIFATLSVETDYLWLDGLQVANYYDGLNGSGDPAFVRGVLVNGIQEIRISNSLLRGPNATVDNGAWGVDVNHVGRAYLWNNVFFDWKTSNSWGGRAVMQDRGDVVVGMYFANNTVIHGTVGLLGDDNTDCRNTVMVDMSNGGFVVVSGASGFAPTSSNNAMFFMAGDEPPPGSSPIQLSSETVTTYFSGAPQGDFHATGPLASELLHGADLSGWSPLMFWRDYEGDSRVTPGSGSVNWRVGADQ